EEEGEAIREPIGGRAVLDVSGTEELDQMLLIKSDFFRVLARRHAANGQAAAEPAGQGYDDQVWRQRNRQASGSDARRKRRQRERRDKEERCQISRPPAG